MSPRQTQTGTGWSRKLQLHVPAFLAGEGDQAPAVRVRAHLHHLLHVLLQSDQADSELVHALWQEVQKGVQQHVPDQLKFDLCGKSYVKDPVQVFAVFDQDVARCSAFQPDNLHFDARLFQPVVLGVPCEHLFQ